MRLPYDPSTLLDHPMVEHTQSSIATFQECPQRYVFKYLMRLNTPSIDIALLVGSAFHAGAQILLDPSTDHVPFVERLAAAMAAVDKFFDGIYESIDAVNVRMDSLPHGHAQARACVEAWSYQLEAMYDKHPFEVRATEYTIRATSDAKVGGLIPPRMAGKLDAILYTVEKRKRLWWVMEHKTRRSGITFDAVGDLDLDRQAIWYMSLAPRALAELGCKGHMAGLMYDAVVKPQHRSGEGAALARRMAAAMMEDPSKYFHFIPVMLGEGTEERFLVNVGRIISRIDNLRCDGVEMSPSACASYRRCPYAPLCKAGADAGRPESVTELVEFDRFNISLASHVELDDGQEA